MRTEYLVPKENDPYAPCAVLRDVAEAQAMAERIGHYHFYEYAVTPGIPGVEPDNEDLAANHYMVESGWVRDAHVGESDAD